MKTIDPDAIALMLFPIEILGGLEEALRELFRKLPTTDGGVEVDEEDFVAAGVKLYYEGAKPLIERMLEGKLPDVSEVEIPEPDEPDDGWVRIIWGGRDPDPSHDRSWWSKTSDSVPVPWVRQFELPSDFPMNGSARFRFSNGYEGRVPDLSARTKYLDRVAGSGRNVKYVKGQPGHPYVYDRKSDIAAPEGVAVEWMEYRVE